MWLIESQQNFTELLGAWSDGDVSAVKRLMPLVEAELRQLAYHYMRREGVNHTLQPTALVNEAYLKLTEQREVRWQNRAHFFAIAAKLMRRILVDQAKGRLRGKRGGGAPHIELNEGNRALAGKERRTHRLG